MKRARSLLVPAVLLVATSLWPRPAEAVNSADQICAPAVDPCTIATPVLIDDGSILDFGAREVRVISTGLLDSGAGIAILRCGKFVAETGAIQAIKARTVGVGGGNFILEARKRCSDNLDVYCFRDSGCKSGTCAAHVCSGRATLACDEDVDCTVGPCQAQRCQRDRLRQCVANADCSVGSCEIDATVCSGRLSRQCTVDGDCDDGLCSVGTGTILLDGVLRAETFGIGTYPGSFDIRSAGDLTVSRTINVSSDVRDEDGGFIDLESGQGSVTINGRIDASGGSDATGGDVTIIGDQDVTVNQDIDVSGGDFDGGFAELDAGRDIFLNAIVTSNATVGEGAGSDIDLFAGRDIALGAAARITSNGSESADSFCGDGGSVSLDAGRNVSVANGAVLQSNGAPPDCGGDAVSIDAGGDVTISGRLESKIGVDGINGYGGAVDVFASGAATVTSTGVIDVTGGSTGGGFIDIIADGDLVFNGSADASAINGGVGEFLTLDSSGDLLLGGDLVIGGEVPPGGINGIVEIQGCGITVATGGSITNDGAEGINEFTVRESLLVQNGAQVIADPTGANEIVYRDPNKPPDLKGTISPAANVTLNEALIGCPLCGDLEIDQGETCDDGNFVSGDGCSADCQDEGCIADTPGYPTVPLCDDGQGCTRDECNQATHLCGNVLDCSDGIDCTTDSCGASNQCQHVAVHSACSDTNPCTTDLCNTNTGCVHVNNGNPCNDGASCTVSDTCSGGSCVGISNCPNGEACNVTTGTCGGFCGNLIVEDGEQCDDGDDEWALGQSCSALCLMLACGDADDSGSISAPDALFILRSAVGLSTCDVCICNVDSSAGGSPINATDALRALRRAVGIPITLTCPVCA